MEAVALDLVHSPASDAVQQAIRRDGPAAVVAIGSHALTAVTAAGYGGPLIATMIMRGDGQDIGEAVNAQVAGAIYLDVPLATLLTELSEIFPRAQRVGIIRNAARPGAVDAGAVAKSRSSGFTIRVVDCARTEDLLPAFLSLKGKVDFVLALPDSALYNSGTLKGLILASIANRLPIIGFSASFVRSGAAVGLFASYRDVGEQTADVVRRVLSRPGVRAVEESPSRWIFAVNLRVLRLIGLEHGQPRSAQLVVYR